MNFSVGQHFEEFIRQQLSAGRYNSADEVICDALRLLEEKEFIEKIKLDKLRELIAEGVNSGPGIPAEEVLARLTAKYQAMNNGV